MDLEKRWSVRECKGCNRRHYFYTNFSLHKDMTEENKYEKSGYTSEDLICWACNGNTEEVSKANWSSSDVVVLYGNELEDRNYHNLIEVPSHLLDALDLIDITEDNKKKVMTEFCNRILGV